MTRIERKRSSPRKASPDALLDAAAQALVDEGFGTSLDRIAERAGVARMTLYRHFGGRDQLIGSLLLRESEQLRTVATSALDDPTAPFADRLHRLLVTLVPAIRRSALLAQFFDQRPAGTLTGPALEATVGRPVFAFFVPYFEAPDARAVLADDPAKTVDWLARVVLVHVTSTGHLSAADLEAEIDSFVMRSVLTPRAYGAWRRRRPRH